MNKVLIIDDERVRIPALTAYALGIVPGAEIIHSETFVGGWDDYTLVMLDHDLGPGGDVYDHARREYPEGYHGDALICIHSMNPVGAMNIRNHVGGAIRPYGTILKLFHKSH